MSGRKAKAPCGHPGTHVVGNYVQCDTGCDAVPKSNGVPEHVDEEKTPKFIDLDLDLDDASTIDPNCSHSRIYMMHNLWWCRACGRNITSH